MGSNLKGLKSKEYFESCTISLFFFFVLDACHDTKIEKDWLNLSHSYTEWKYLSMNLWMCPKMKFLKFIYEHLQCTNHYISELSVYSEMCLTTFINIFCGTTLIWWCFWKTWLWLSTYTISFITRPLTTCKWYFQKVDQFCAACRIVTLRKIWMCFNVVYLILLYVKVFFSFYYVTITNLITQIFERTCPLSFSGPCMFFAFRSARRGL